jgi:L-ascorbate metabolism protein UlaG (beta-lactamase superfamily)
VITPALFGDTFLADVDEASKDWDAFHLWWLGQSGYLIHWQGDFLLLDPYLSDSLTHKYANTDKPHVRMTERIIEPDRLDFVAGVTSSHNHTDHLDAETLVPLMKANRQIKIVVPSANRDFAAERLQVEPRRLTPVDVGSSVMVSQFAIHGVPAAHEKLDLDEQGRFRHLGYIIRMGPWSVYHSGDTVLYDGMVERLKPWDVDVALLPINGRVPERRVSGNLWGQEAAQLAHDIGARMVIPGHYDMFEFNTVTPDDFVTAAKKLGQPYRILQCGERWSSREL